nr:hypothetical protein [Prevotella sp.]
MNTKIDKKKLLLFLIVAGLLMYITKSFLMSFGIFLLLFVGDNFAQELDNKRKNKKEKK